MIIDASLLFSDSQPITATVTSTNIVDLGTSGTPLGTLVALPADIAIDNRIDILLNVTQAFNNLTSLSVALQVSADASTWKEVVTRTYLLADLSSVGQLPFPASLPVGSSLRYMQLNYTVNGTAPTFGKIFAAIVAARQSNNH